MGDINLPFKFSSNDPDSEFVPPNRPTTTLAFLFPSFNAPRLAANREMQSIPT